MVSSKVWGQVQRGELGEQAGGVIGKSIARTRTILGESEEQGRGGGSRSEQDPLLARRTGRNTNLGRVHYSAFKTCPSQESPCQSSTSRLVGSLWSGIGVQVSPSNAGEGVSRRERERSTHRPRSARP